MSFVVRITLLLLYILLAHCIEAWGCAVEIHFVTKVNLLDI